MPPKGWRKNADGTYPVITKDQELTSIDEILFPKSLVQKVAKTMLESDNLIAKDCVTALQRSATVFVSHLMFHANLVSKSQDRKTVNAQDIIAALGKAGYGSFETEVKRKVALYEREIKEKKQRKAEKEGQGDNDDIKRLGGDIKGDSQSDSDKDTNEEEDEQDIVEVDDINEDENQEEHQDENVETNPIALSIQDEHELEGSTIEEIVSDPESDQE